VLEAYGFENKRIKHLDIHCYVKFEFGSQFLLPSVGLSFHTASLWLCLGFDLTLDFALDPITPNDQDAQTLATLQTRKCKIGESGFRKFCNFWACFFRLLTEFFLKTEKKC